MQLKFPCKQCLVSVCCREKCDKYQDFWNTREHISKRFAQTLTLAAFITLGFSLL